MLRKLFLTAALAAASATGVAVTPSTAEAQPPIQRGYGDNDVWRGRNDWRRDRYRYEVLVRHGDHWHSHGKYRDRDGVRDRRVRRDAAVGVHQQRCGPQRESKQDERNAGRIPQPCAHDQCTEQHPAPDPRGQA